MNKNTTRWMAEYLDDFDVHCQKTECKNCPVDHIHKGHKEESCFRIYCELRDAGKIKVK